MTSIKHTTNSYNYTTMNRKDSMTPNIHNELEHKILKPAKSETKFVKPQKFIIVEFNDTPVTELSSIRVYWSHLVS